MAVVKRMHSPETCVQRRIDSQNIVRGENIPNTLADRYNGNANSITSGCRRMPGGRLKVNKAFQSVQLSREEDDTAEPKR